MDKAHLVKFLKTNPNQILSWILIGGMAIALLVVGLLLHGSMKADAINNPNFKTMDEGLLYLIFSVLALIITQIANPIHLKRYKRTVNYVQSIERVVLETKNDLSNRISSTENTLKFYIVERDISNALHKIITDSLTYIPSEKSGGILQVGEFIVNFALGIHDFGVHQYNNKQLCINVNTLNSNIYKALEKEFGKGFVADITKDLHAKMIEYKDKIKAIAADSVLNSKQNRFRAVSELFMQEYLGIIIVNYLDKKD